jgi:outer membrane protein TolC
MKRNVSFCRNQCKRSIANFAVFSVFIISILFFSVKANAQVNTGMKTMLPDSVIERRLVELALKGPEMQSSDHQSKINEYQLRNAKNAWMNLLTFSINYNDQTFHTVPGNYYVYPKYFIGLNVPLGTLFSRTPVKAANEAVEIGHLDRERLRRKVTADVLSKYQEYKAQSELIAMETGTMNDVEAALGEAKDKFRKNEISFEIYNGVQRSRNDEYVKMVNLKLQQELIKLEIERMIGTSLETVLR